jgi:hypothetical protein
MFFFCKYGDNRAKHISKKIKLIFRSSILYQYQNNDLILQNEMNNYCNYFHATNNSDAI